MTHKELTAHLRKRLAVSGIKARCRMYVACGEKVISIVPPTADALFTDEEQVIIATMGIVNHLTLVRGLPIDPHQGTFGPGFQFRVGKE